MRLEYRLNINDHQEANRAQLIHAKGIFILIWLFLVLLLITNTISRRLISLFIAPAAMDSNSSLILIINGLLFIVLLLVLYWMFQLAINRAWNSQPSLHDPMLVEVNEEGFVFNTPKINSQADWQVFTRFHETKNLFMIYQAEVCTNLVPKRAFETEEQLNEFRTLLRRKIVK